VTIFNTLLFFVRRGLVIASARAEFPAVGGQHPTTILKLPPLALLANSGAEVRRMPSDCGTPQLDLRRELVGETP
jgi:hypothetical protein